MTDTGSGLRHAPSMSTEVLKALANPLRRQVWNEVTRSRYARAADLAKRLDQPANTLSFHLRVLAQAGLIEEAPEKARDKRDRVWKPTSGAMSLGSPEDPVADQVLGSAVMAGFIDDARSLLTRVANWAGSYVTGEDATERGVYTTATLRLSRERFIALIDQLDQVVTSFRDDPEDDETLTWELSMIGASEEI